MNSDRCPICMVELVLDETVFLDTCHHKFCSSCARELIMHDEYPRVQCPMDKILSDHVGHFDKPKNIFGSIQYLYVNETTHEYLKHDIEKDPTYFTCDSEDKLTELLILCNEAIHYFDYKLNLFKDTLEQVNKIVLNAHAENNESKKKEVYKKIEYLSMKLEDKINSIKEINCAHYTKYDILLEFISDRDAKGDSLFDPKNVICILMQQYLLIFKKFISEHFRYFNEPDIFTSSFYSNAIHAVDKEISSMKDLSMFITMISVSYITNSRNLYKAIQPHIDEVNSKTCLICTAKITGNHYGGFKVCEHKLCMHCIKTMWISQGHCPLDGDVTNDLEIVKVQTNKINAWLHNTGCSVKCKSPFEYLVEKFKKYSERNFDELFHYIVDRVKEINSVLSPSLKLLRDLIVLFDEESKTHRDSELINATKGNIIHILNHTENHKFRYNDSVSLMKFYGILANYRTMDSKCHKYHTFDALVEDRIDELMITLEELVPFKKWLCGFEHLIDAVCMLMNSPRSEKCKTNVKIIIKDFLTAFEGVFYKYVNPADEHLYYASQGVKFSSLDIFIEDKKNLDKHFEKHEELYTKVKEYCYNNFK